MYSWREEYIAALQVRNSKESKNEAFYRSYTKLAEKVTSLESNSLPHEPSKPEKRLLENFNLPPKQLPILAVDKVREDLAEAQQIRTALQGQLSSVTEDLARLQTKSRAESRCVNELLSEKQGLSMKLRDKDEELRGKAKLLENIHDETVSLTLQLNMAEANCQKLQAENKELVDRWMTRMAQEAEAMNFASNFS